jgi:hypothetical protein
MKAIFIDAERREIREVEYSPTGSGDEHPSVNHYVGGWIEAAWRWDNGDVLFVDEEGLLKATMHFFLCKFRTDQPMAGNGLLVGREVEDEDVQGGYYTTPPTMTVERLRDQIIWMSRDDFDRWGLAHADEPAATITTVRGTEVLNTYGQLLSGMPRKEPENDNE